MTEDLERDRIEELEREVERCSWYVKQARRERWPSLSDWEQKLQRAQSELEDAQARPGAYPD